MGSNTDLGCTFNHYNFLDYQYEFPLIMKLRDVSHCDHSTLNACGSVCPIDFTS